jgi:cell division protein FtsB
MHVSLRKIGYAVLLLGGAAYGFVELRGPNGVSAIAQKRQEIQKLEQENEGLHREIEAEKTRIERLKTNPDEQEMEIRKELKLMKPGEKSYIMPDQKEPAGR